jgi:hypothetical protein
VHCIIYVLGEDDPRVELQLPFSPSRGHTVRFSNRSWSVAEVELRIEGDLLQSEPYAHLVIWVEEARRH